MSIEVIDFMASGILTTFAALIFWGMFIINDDEDDK